MAILISKKGYLSHFKRSNNAGIQADEEAAGVIEVGDRA